MRILLTGADGFTGRPFAELARRDGHDVVALQADLTNSPSLAEEVARVRPQAVVHLAAIAFVGHEHEEAFYTVNVVGTTNLLDALKQCPVRPQKVLLASSANVYGNCEHSPIVETAPPAPINHYAMSKLAMEQLARTYMDQLDIVITRPFNYTGPGQSTDFLIPKLAAHFAQHLPSISLGNLHVEREFNDIRMVCEAYLKLLTLGLPGETYNVCSGRPHDLQTVIDTFRRLTGHSLEVNVNPAFVRANEVHSLYGSPRKLQALLGSAGQPLNSYSLEETLIQVLNSF